MPQPRVGARRAAGAAPARPAGAGPGSACTSAAGSPIWQIAAWREAEVAPLARALAERLGVALPEGPAAAGAAGRVLFHGSRRGAGGWSRRLAAALAARLAAARRRPRRADRSAAMRGACSASAGRRAGVLAKLCRIDLHPRALPAGRVAQTPLGQVPALIHALDDEPCFDLYLPRSLAGSAVASLIDAAEEFGLELGS